MYNHYEPYVFWSAIILVILNALDVVLTLLWIDMNVGVEANPLMVILIDISPILFVGVKMTLIILGVILLIRFEHHKIARVGLYGCTVVYFLLFGYHMYMPLLMLGLI